MSPSSPSRTELRSILSDSSLLSFDSGTDLKSGITSVAFWTAIVLPFLHLPLLATGLESTSVLVAFAALLALNVVAVVLGQPYGRD
jgi:hypothetical protein